MSQINDSKDTPTPENGEDLKFRDLALLPAVHKAIDAIGYETPSPIQAQIIPHFLEGRDILGVAQTGTGKTAAFALPLLTNIILNRKNPQSICLVPTRELAIQVAEAFQRYAKFIKGFNVLPIYGGTEYGSQIRQLGRGVHVVVGTPGRVMDHIRKGTLNLGEINTLILDEADEMLSMGFIDDIEWVLQHMPEKHQTALFSATMPRQIRKIADQYLNDPAEISIKVKTATAPTIHQRFLQVRNNDKLDTLTRIMEVEQFDGMLIFVRTKNATLEVAERLQARGYAAEALNGDIVQSQREKTVDRLKKGNIDILVATDVAARGLDVERISHVINYDVPYDAESYVHRIGRTGRAGRKGDAILFVNGRESRLLQMIERTTRKKIERFKFPSVDVLNERKIEQLFSRIDAVLQTDLTEYRSVIVKYLSRQEEVDPIAVAAAMASLEAGNKPFYIKQAFKDPEPVWNDRKERGRRRGERPERRGGKRFARENVATETYRLEVGEGHGVSKGDIVGAIANEAGIESRYMGKIRMYEEHSFIDLPENLSSSAYKTLKTVTIRGHQLHISKEAGFNATERGARPPWETGGTGRPVKKKKPGKIKKKKSRRFRD